MATPVPEEHFAVNDRIVAYVGEISGSKYVYIMKVYSKDGQLNLKKGLCVSKEDFDDLAALMPQIVEYVGEQV